MVLKNKKERAKLLSLVLLLALVVSISAPLMSYAAAADNNYGFSFKIKADQLPSKNDDKRYRGTDRTDSAWKVQFNTSSESGIGKTKTIFYLGAYNPNGNNKVASAYHTIKEGSEAKYYSAYTNASKKYVYLYGKDNDDGSTSGYTVTGLWDEETGKSPVNDGED